MHFADDITDFLQYADEHFVGLRDVAREELEHRDRRVDAHDGKRDSGCEPCFVCRVRERQRKHRLQI